MLKDSSTVKMIRKIISTVLNTWLTAAFSEMKSKVLRPIMMPLMMIIVRIVPSTISLLTKLPTAFRDEDKQLVLSFWDFGLSTSFGLMLSTKFSELMISFDDVEEVGAGTIPGVSLLFFIVRSVSFCLGGCFHIVQCFFFHALFNVSL